MHQCTKFILFGNDNLHVSDGLSVHHQEFKAVHTATGICQKDTAVCLVHLVGFTIEIILRCTALWTSNFRYNMVFMHYSNAQSSSVDLTYFHSCCVLYKQDWKFLHNPFLNLHFMGSFPFIRGSIRITRGLGPTMTTRGQSIGISIGMLPQTLIMSITVQKTSKYYTTEFDLEDGF